jgi:hypothetical protein
MRINPILYGFLVLTVFFGIILGFQAAGIWSISGKVDAAGEEINPSAEDVNTIKGWMTLEQITATYNVSLADLLKEFELPADTLSSTAIKDLESDQFSVTNLRTWLQSQDQSTSLPAQANNATPVPNQPIVPTEGPTQSSGLTSENSTPATPAPTEHAAPVKTITGKTTFQELLDWGVPVDSIQNIIGGALPPPATVIKDYVTGKGLEFAAIKTGLQSEVDKTN